MSEWPGSIGPYKVLNRLGTGGMGTVYLAYDARLDRCVAVKQYHGSPDISPERRERFRREARLMAGLNHPAIVQIYDIIYADDTDSMIMEYVPGQTLRHLLRDRPFAIDRVLVLARQIASGLAMAHDRGIVHRDLKSENILVNAAGQAKITDFGIAKDIVHEEEMALTEDNAMLGTYRSMSPEQARGETVTPRSDLFALGIMLYEALTGKTPFKSKNRLNTLNRIINYHPTPVIEERGEVPEPLSNLVGFLLQKEEQERPRDARQVVQILEEIYETHVDDDDTLEIDDHTFGTSSEQSDYTAGRLELLEHLRESVDFFSAFTKDEFSHIIGKSARKKYQPGEYIIHQGTTGKEMFIILRGMVQIRQDLNGESIDVKTMSAGECFGEMAIIDNHPRSASVVAREETELVSIKESELRKNQPELCLKLYRGIASTIAQKLRLSDARYLGLLSNIKQLAG